MNKVFVDTVELTPMELPLVKRLLLYWKEFGDSDFWLGFTRDEVQVLDGLLARMRDVDVSDGCVSVLFSPW